MTENLLEQIEQAESRAEEIRKQAAEEAREMVKASEEACLAEERQSLKQIRDEAQCKVDEMRLETRKEIGVLEVRRSAERDAMREMAKARVASAGNAIFERIVGNGNR